MVSIGTRFQIGDQLDYLMYMQIYTRSLMHPEAAVALQLDVMVASFILLMQMLLHQTSQIKIRVIT